MMGKPTEEELELLTEEEIAALEIDENATDGDEPEADEPEDKDDEVKDDPDNDDEPEPADKGDDPDNPDDGDDKGDPPADDPENDDTPPAEDVEVPKVDFKPQIETKLPDALKQKIDAQAKELNADLETKLAGLKEQYDNGDIDATEYFDQASPIRDQIAENKAEVRDEIRSAWVSQQESDQRWNAEQDAFFKIYPDYDAPRYDDDNKLVSGNPVLYGALDAACKKVSRENPGISGVDLLIKAKAEVDEAMGLGKAAGKTNGEQKPPSADRPKPTVGDLPNASPEDVGGGEFAHLDKLSGDALEEALEKLPADKRERYLAGA